MYKGSPIPEVKRVTSVNNKMPEAIFEWIVHIKRRHLEVLITRFEKITLWAYKRGREPKKIYGKILHKIYPSSLFHMI